MENQMEAKKWQTRNKKEIKMTKNEKSSCKHMKLML